VFRFASHLLFSSLRSSTTLAIARTKLRFASLTNKGALVGKPRLPRVPLFVVSLTLVVSSTTFFYCIRSKLLVKVDTSQVSSNLIDPPRTREITNISLFVATKSATYPLRCATRDNPTILFTPKSVVLLLRHQCRSSILLITQPNGRATRKL